MTTSTSSQSWQPRPVAELWRVKQQFRYQLVQEVLRCQLEITSIDSLWFATVFTLDEPKTGSPPDAANIIPSLSYYHCGWCRGLPSQGATRRSITVKGRWKKWFPRAIFFTRATLAFGRFDPWWITWINTPLSLSGGSHENQRMSMSFFGGIRDNPLPE